MPTRRHRVLLADDHAMVAEALAGYLREEFELVAVVNDGAKLLEAARRLRPEIIVADISMPVLSGLEALRALRSEGLAARVVFLTMHDDPDLAREAIRQGASGYLLKHSAGEELTRAIREVAAGRTYLTPRIARAVLSVMTHPARGSLASLTRRQRDVLKLVAQGFTMKEAAAALHISPRTVETHKYKMMEALGVTTGAELIQFALRHGVIGGAPGPGTGVTPPAIPR